MIELEAFWRWSLLGVVWLTLVYIIDVPVWYDSPFSPFSLKSC
jgi:hypothetical protein